MFGRTRRAIRAQVSAAGNCDGLFFSERLSPQSVRSACEKLQHEFRDRIFSPAITLWVFLAQVLSADHSCREAVAKLNFWRLARGLKPCGPNVGVVIDAPGARSFSVGPLCDQQGIWPAAVVASVHGSKGGPVSEPIQVP